MPKINIHLHVDSLKRKDEPEERPEVWPTMLPDDDLMMAKPQFEFFDLWTTPIELVPTKIDLETFSVPGYYTRYLTYWMWLNIEYSQTDDQGVTTTSTAAVCIDHFYFDSDANKTIIAVNRYLGEVPDDCTKVTLWKDTPNLSIDPEQVASYTVDINHPEKQPINSTTVCYLSSDSRVPEDTISSELDDSNEDRWNRKPIALPDADMYRDDPNTKRWMTGGGYSYNLRVDLKSDEDTSKFKGNPDTIADGEEDFKLQGTNESWAYRGKLKSVSSGYISVKEIGSRSVCHYIKKDTEICYATDQVDGIFFIPFDTSDTTQYKVTNEPSFDADEVEPRFISSRKKYKVFVCSRRAAYYTRTSKIQKGDEIITVRSGTVNKISVYYEDHYNVATQQPGESQWEWPTPVPQDFMCATGDTTLIDFDEVTSEPDTADWEELPDFFGFMSAKWCTEVGPHHENQPGGQNGINGHFESMAYWLKAKKPVQTRWVGVWWDRLPHTLALQKIRDTGDGVIYFPVRGQDNDNISPETFTIFQDNTFSVEKEEDENALCGINAIHLLSGLPTKPDGVHLTEPCGKFNVGGPGNQYPYMYPGIQKISNIPDMKCRRKELSAVSPLQTLWEKISGTVDLSTPQTWEQSGDTLIPPFIPTMDSSAFWNAHGLPSFTEDYHDEWSGVQWDNLPYGVGLSPAMTGELCGVVVDVASETPYFIWRRADEDLEIILTPRMNDYQGHKTSFESASQDNDGLSNVVDSFTDYGFNSTNGTLDFCDQFYIESGRKLTDFGRDMADETGYWANESDCELSYDPRPGKTSCDNALHAPIFVLVSKERAIRSQIPLIGVPNPFLSYRSLRTDNGGSSLTDGHFAAVRNQEDDVFRNV